MVVVFHLDSTSFRFSLLDYAHTLLWQPRQFSLCVSLQGLPTDDLSVQNGIMVTRATRYPVLVDPQGQGRTWIMHREEANQLKVTQLNDKLFRNHLEVCAGAKFAAAYVRKQHVVCEFAYALMRCPCS